MTNQAKNNRGVSKLQKPLRILLLSSFPILTNCASTGLLLQPAADEKTANRPMNGLGGTGNIADRCSGIGGTGDSKKDCDIPVIAPRDLRKPVKQQIKLTEKPQRIDGGPRNVATHTTPNIQKDSSVFNVPETVKKNFIILSPAPKPSTGIPKMELAESGFPKPIPKPQALPGPKPMNLNNKITAKKPLKITKNFSVKFKIK